LYLEAVCRRVIEQYAWKTGMIPSSESRYTRIKQCLEDKTTLAYLHFVAYVAASLTPFLKLFQRDEPLVHILYDKVNEVTRICFRMFLKTEVVAEKVENELKAIDCDCQMISRRLYDWNSEKV